METMEKKGIDSGLKCTHPITGGAVPIWIANFVLMWFFPGTPVSSTNKTEIVLKVVLITITLTPLKLTNLQ
jgi:leucyl-tRNA synthetase